MTTSTKRPDGGELNSEIVRLIDELRRDEGDSVTFISDNPDFNGQPNCAIVCNGDWTGYEDRRFAADTILDALSSAATERKLPTARQVIAESNGHHWVQRFNLVCCRDCGIVRRADDKNSPCKGIVTVELRSPTNESLAPHPPVEGLREALEEIAERCEKASHAAAPICLTESHVDHLRQIASYARSALASPSLTAGAGKEPILWQWRHKALDGPWSDWDVISYSIEAWRETFADQVERGTVEARPLYAAPATLTEQPSEAPPSAPDVREALYKAIYEANGCTLNDGEAVRRAIDITIAARPSTPPVADREAIIRECASIAVDHTPKKFEGTLAAHATGRAIECAILALLSALPAKGER